MLGMTLPPTEPNNAVPSEDDLTRGMAQYCDEVTAGGHLWQVYVGREARHIVVPVGLNECGQMRIVHAWGYGKKVLETVFEKAIARRWNIRGVE